MTHVFSNQFPDKDISILFYHYILAKEIFLNQDTDFNKRLDAIERSLNKFKPKLSELELEKIALILKADCELQTLPDLSEFLSLLDHRQ